MNSILKQATRLYALEGCGFKQLSAHEGGRNLVYSVRRDGVDLYILRVSCLNDRTYEDYLAETEFVRYLAENGAPVADAVSSVQGNLAERVTADGCKIYLTLFKYAKGMLISDNGYRYRDGAPLEEYFYNTGKALGAIHRLSKRFTPVHRRADYSQKYNMSFIDRLIPDEYARLKRAISERLEKLRALPRDAESYGLVHFDFSDGNYHIDMATGALTVFDFDNCAYCWYMFDIANLWTHGEGWVRGAKNAAERMAGMKWYFDSILEGYRSETSVPDALMAQLPLFIDLVLIENIVDEFECCAREGEELDYDDIRDAAEALINGTEYAGMGQ